MSTTACDDQFAPELVANQRVRLPDGSIARVIAALGNGLYKVAEPDKPAYITTSDNIYHREDLETTMSNNANDILLAAAGHMTDRAATYDKPQGERSMAATVDAFRATTGIELTEEQGWHFMCLLKLVRSQQGGYRADNYEDLTAYAALTGEAAANSRPNLNTESSEPEAPEWTIGSRCLWRLGDVCMGEHTILAKDDDTYWVKDGYGGYDTANREDIRPIHTPAQQAEDEAVEEMAPILRAATGQLGSSKAKAAARALYRAGYRRLAEE